MPLSLERENFSQPSVPIWMRHLPRNKLEQRVGKETIMRRVSIMLVRSVSSSALPVPSGERSEPDGTGRTFAPPNPEVISIPVRRRFSVEHKLRILRMADACTEFGSLGALLRREGLYATNLRTWRRQIEADTRSLEAREKGPMASGACHSR